LVINLEDFEEIRSLERPSKSKVRLVMPSKISKIRPSYKGELKQLPKTLKANFKKPKVRLLATVKIELMDKPNKLKAKLAIV
jgi:hypothetical protein